MIPNDIKLPKGAEIFMKLESGANTFRVVGEVKQGWEGWKDVKPHRHEGSECKITPDMVDLNQNGKPNINYFWVFPVYDYKTKSYRILELTQKTIMRSLLSLQENPEWGSLEKYDVVVNKVKEGDKTSYLVQANPPKTFEIDKKEVDKLEVEISKMFDWNHLLF